MANELKLANPIVVGSAATDPVTAYNGEVYYNTTSNKFRKYENGSWSDLASSGLTGQPLNQNNVLVGDGSNLSAAVDTSSVGDILADSSGGLTIKASSVTNSDLANMAAHTLKGNNTGSSAAPSDLTVSQVNSMLGDILADGSVAFTADQSMGSHKLTNVTDPTSAQDAATKNYVDNLSQGLSWKEVVRAASTGNLNLASMPASVDGVTLNNGDRFLAKDQSTLSENGLYIFNGAASAATRSTDADTALELQWATVEVGADSATQAGYIFREANDITTLGTDDVAFAIISHGLDWTFNNGLSTTGNQVNVAPGDNSLTATAGSLVVKEDPAGAISTGASGIKVNVDGSTTQISSNNVAVKLDSGATTGNIVSSGSGLKNQLESSNPTLQISSNQLGVKLDSSRAITTGTSGIGVNVDNSTIDISGNAIEVKAGGITNTQVNASAAIAYSKLAALTANRIPSSNASGILVDNDSTDKELVANSLRRSKSAGSFVHEEYVHSTTLTDNTSTPTSVTALQFAHGTYAAQELTYVIATGAGTPDLRMGTIKVVSNGTSTSIIDSFTETADCGVTWSASISGANTLINYTTTSQGSDRTLRADRKLFLK